MFNSIVCLLQSKSNFQQKLISNQFRENFRSHFFSFMCLLLKVPTKQKLKYHIFTSSTKMFEITIYSCWEHRKLCNHCNYKEKFVKMHKTDNSKMFGNSYSDFQRLNIQNKNIFIFRTSKCVNNNSNCKYYVKSQKTNFYCNTR